MWSREERTRSYFGTTLREAADLGQMAMIVQDTGSGPSLDDVTTLLDARPRLRKAYDNMVKEAKRFVSTDTMFTERPHFYDELISLVHTTGDSVDEALAMSKEYLCNISDIEGTFHTSAAICSQLSSQITRLASKEELSHDEARDLESMKDRSRRIFQRMENQLTQVTRRARAGKDTITFPKLQDQVRTTRLNIARTHVPGKHRAHLSATDAANKPANDPVTNPRSTATKPTEHDCDNQSKKISPTTSGTVRVKAVITEITMGDRDTPRRKHEDTAHSEYTGRGRPGRPFASETLRQTRVRARATSLYRPFGVIPTRQRSITHPTMRLTTDGDRLVPTRKIQQSSDSEEEVQYIPYRPHTQAASTTKYMDRNTPRPEPVELQANKNGPPLDADQLRTSSPVRCNSPVEVEVVNEVEVVDLEDEGDNRPTPFRRPTPRRQQWLHEIAFEDYERTRRKADPPTTTTSKTVGAGTTDGADPLKEFLAPFRHGFHREIVTGPREQIKIYYITPCGVRVGSRMDLEPYLEEFWGIGQKNFNFQPITLQFKDPLHKYQSTRKIPTPYKPPRCPQWLHEVNFRASDTPYPRQTQKEKPKLQGLMDVTIDITTLPRGYLWQIDQKRQRRIKSERPVINPEPRRSEHRERKDSQQPKNTMLPKRPMTGIYKVMNYKEKPPDKDDRHDWPWVGSP